MWHFSSTHPYDMYPFGRVSERMAAAQGCFVPHLPVVQRWWTVPVFLFTKLASYYTCPPFCSLCSYQTSRSRWFPQGFGVPGRCLCAPFLASVTGVGWGPGITAPWGEISSRKTSSSGQHPTPSASIRLSSEPHVHVYCKPRVFSEIIILCVQNAHDPFLNDWITTALIYIFMS